MLGGLAADQRAAGQHAPVGDAADDRRHPLRDQPPADQVIGHEQRLSAAHHEIIDHHPDQVDAHGVVLA
jgi:hypothetical protein